MKYQFDGACNIAAQSPPSRGAWIEIVAVAQAGQVKIVAPLAGGVD